jgi:hypothetical protein
VLTVELDKPGEIVWMAARKRREVGVDVVFELGQQSRKLVLEGLVEAGKVHIVHHGRAAPEPLLEPHGLRSST